MGGWGEVDHGSAGAKRFNQRRVAAESISRGVWVWGAVSGGGGRGKYSIRLEWLFQTVFRDAGHVVPLLVMLLKGVIEFPKVPNYQSPTQKLLLPNNGLFTANVLSAMILSDTNVSRSCYRTGPAYRAPPPLPPSFTGFKAV